jgi:hypothetical protein
MVEMLVLDTSKPYHRLFPATTVQSARERMAQYEARHLHRPAVARKQKAHPADASRSSWPYSLIRDRIIVRGKTKTEVKEQAARQAHRARAGVRTPARYTVEQCLKHWLETLNTQAESTITGYQIMVGHLAEMIGNIKLVELKVRDVDFALGKLAKRLSTRSVRLARMILIQAIRNAMVNDLVVRR